MKKMILSLALGLVLGGTAQAASYNVITRGVNDVKVHDYIISSGGTAQVVEGPNELVVLDVPATVEDNADFLNFVRSLDKKVAAAVISHSHEHHWLGMAEMFPGVPIYSPDVEGINNSVEKALEDARPLMGELRAPVARKLENGRVTLGGVKFEITSLPGLGAVIIGLPDQRTAIVHHLGYVGVHVPLPPFDARNAELEKLSRAGYNWFIGGHGQPRGPEFVQQVKEYTDFVTRATASAADPAEAKAAIVNRYPNYGTQGLLDMLLPVIMQKNEPAAENADAAAPEETVAPEKAAAPDQAAAATEKSPAAEKPQEKKPVTGRLAAPEKPLGFE